jgi:hypothetical protein
MIPHPTLSKSLETKMQRYDIVFTPVFQAKKPEKGGTP